MLYTEKPNASEINLEKAVKKLAKAWNDFQKAKCFVVEEVREKKKKESGEAVLAARQAVYDASREFAMELNFIEPQN